MRVSEMVQRAAEHTERTDTLPSEEMERVGMEALSPAELAWMRAVLQRFHGGGHISESITAKLFPEG